jgi:release factor glutamine methyltransferase
MTIGQLVRLTTDRLRQAGVERPALDARLLVALGLGVEAGWVFSHPEHEPDPEAIARVEAAVARRERREPVSRITGRREFWGMEFLVTAATLDPRPDTETVVEAVLERVGAGDRKLDILDLGTGTGCILLSLLRELPNAVGVGVDIDAAALAAASENARRLGLSDRSSFRRGDWDAGLDRVFDVVVANPPYIAEDAIDGLAPEVARFEPRLALAGGADGLACYRAIAPALRRRLVAGGTAALEVGSGQAAAVSSLLTAAAMSVVAVRRDLAGIDRVVIAESGKV